MTSRLAVTVAAATLMLSTIAPEAHAQTPALLNSLEVRLLVDGDGPADHIGLRDHFLALAVRYDQQARRHEAIARAMAGNPNRSTPLVGAHAARLSAEARAAAATVRHLAVFHERVAAGVPALPPAGAGAFHDGKGAPAPTAGAIRAIAATVRTSAGHRAMAEYFTTAASRHRDEAGVQVQRARSYRALANDRAGGVAALQCDRRARAARQAAARADARALVHRQLSTLVGID